MSKKLFAFDRDLPEPFNTATKRVKGVKSQYSSITYSTLETTVAKAVLAYAKMQSGEALGGLGKSKDKTVAEYKSSMADEYHLVVYDPSHGNMLAIVYNANTLEMELYTVGAKARDGAALMLALLPALMKDSEFDTQLKVFCEQQRLGFPDLPLATNTLAVLCDNAYRRIIDDQCPAYVKTTVDTSGNITRINKTQIDSKVFEPTTVLAGEFAILGRPDAGMVYRPAPVIPHGDFVGKYRLNPGRVLNAKEQAHISVLQPFYIIPEQIVSVCRHAQATTGRPTQMRNFMLRGPAGTGKTKGAEAIAAGLGLPYVDYTCSSGTEIFDFIGQVFPNTENLSTGDPILDAQRQELQAMGGVTYENVAKLMKLPGLDDMDYDPAGVYAKVAGVVKADATAQDCMAVILNLVTDKVRELCFVPPESGSGGQTYTYIETDFIRAIKYGWLCEIKEPTTITQPGVLVGLNTLLEQSGAITLPTGEVIRRHPDAVVVITTNISYEGCRGLNQSVLDRMNLVYDIELPPEEVMVQRAMSVTGCDDDVMVMKMVKVVAAMTDYCRARDIRDGTVGMRSLIDWIISAEITGDPYTSALYTVISKATADEEARESLIAAALEPFFIRARAAA